MASALTREDKQQPTCQAPPQVLFPQMRAVVERCLREFVDVVPPARILGVFLSPYYEWVIERLVEATGPDTSKGEAPEVPRYGSSRGAGSTWDANF